MNSVSALGWSRGLVSQTPPTPSEPWGLLGSIWEVPIQVGRRARSHAHIVFSSVSLSLCRCLSLFPRVRAILHPGPWLCLAFTALLLLARPPRLLLPCSPPPPRVQDRPLHT